MQLSAQDETFVQELVAQGNDAVATRLVFELLNLGYAPSVARMQRLLDMGARSMALALQQEDGIQEDQQLPSLLERRTNQHLSMLPIVRSSAGRNERALTWYRDAVTMFSAAIRQATQSQDRCTAYIYRALATAALDCGNEVLADFSAALPVASSSEQLAGVYYWHGIVCMQFGNLSSALVDFTYALGLAPQNEQYRSAQERALQQTM
ncbi:MAG: hypothetical protein H0U76_18615 [Ktedonobacteraceae bacterium]|nr:hypothetical protein [Ktedonobacteraceae bacterium]